MHPFKAIALGMILMGNFMLSSIGIGNPTTDKPTTSYSDTRETYGSKHHQSPAQASAPPESQKLRYGDRIPQPTKPDPVESN